MVSDTLANTFAKLRLIKNYLSRKLSRTSQTYFKREATHKNYNFYEFSMLIKKPQKIK